MTEPIESSFRTSCLVIQIKQTDKCWLYVNKKKEEARILWEYPEMPGDILTVGFEPGHPKQPLSTSFVTFGVIYKNSHQRTNT